jgi:hypothetical protein
MPVVHAGTRPSPRRSRARSIVTEFDHEESWHGCAVACGRVTRPRREALAGHVSRIGSREVEGYGDGAAPWSRRVPACSGAAPVRGRVTRPPSGTPDPDRAAGRRIVPGWGNRERSARRSWTWSDHDAVLQVRHPGRLDGADLGQPHGRGRHGRTGERRRRAGSGRCGSSISSTSSAAGYWLITSAPPPTRTSLPPAARLAWSSADPVGVEGERRGRQGQPVTLVMRQDEHRLVERRILTPPAPPRPPTSAARRAELASTHDLGADIGPLLHRDRRTRVDRDTVHRMRLADGVQLEGPIVPPPADRTERVSTL